MPARNRVEALREAVESVAVQSYQNIELIVVDDGSDPPIGPVVTEVWTSLRPINALTVVSVSEGNGNRARNAGLRIASGEYIQFIDSDDILESEKLSCQVARLKDSPDLDAVICRVAFFDSKGPAGLWNSAMQNGQPVLGDFIAHRCDWQTMAPLWRRRIFDSGLQWAPDIPCLQDWFFHMQALAAGARVLLDMEVLAHYRLPEAGHVSWRMNTPEKLRKRIEVYRKASQHLRKAGHTDAQLHHDLSRYFEPIKMDGINQQDLGAYFLALRAQILCDRTIRGLAQAIARLAKSSWLLANIGRGRTHNPVSVDTPR